MLDHKRNHTQAECALTFTISIFRLLAEFMHPGTFDGVCLIDPVMNIKPRELRKRGERFPLSAAILKRRDTWESRYVFKNDKHQDCVDSSSISKGRHVYNPCQVDHIGRSSFQKFCITMWYILSDILTIFEYTDTSKNRTTGFMMHLMAL